MPEKNLRAKRKTKLQRPERMVEMGVTVAEGVASAHRRDRREDPQETPTPVRAQAHANAEPAVPAGRAIDGARAAIVATATTTVTAKERRAAAATMVAIPTPKRAIAVLGKKEAASHAPTATAAEAKEIAEDHAQEAEKEMGERSKLGASNVQK